VIVDSSVLVAMMLSEPEGSRIEAALKRNPSSCLSAVNHFEASMVLISRIGPNAAHDLDRLLELFLVRIVPFTDRQARIARRAFLLYGRGRHAAGLNFGDCMAYALAKETGEELLFKGTDFGLTDVAVAAY
jgi:ribonuclease VapC